MLRFAKTTRVGIALIVLAMPAGGQETADVAVDGPIDPTDAQLDWHWILVKDRPDMPCPSAAGWTGEPLLAEAGTPPAAIATGLRPFCHYTWDGRAAVRPNDVARLHRAIGPYGDVGADFLAVVAAGDLDDLLWRGLESRFLTQAGRVALAAAAAPRPRLAIVDTAATRDFGVAEADHTGNSPHGYTLARMARELLCASGGGGGEAGGKGGEGEGETCVADVVTRLGLSYLAFDSTDPAASPRDLVDGGYVGTIAELAQAIRGAVADAAADPAAGRLVLNLSVAWHPRFGGLEHDPEDMPPVVRAALRALEHAACRGAIAVAAAGNRDGGPGDGDLGPLLPAAWEQRKRPDADTCALALDPQEPIGDDPPATPYAPLLWAAGGAEVDGAPLANGRHGGLPALVAYGAQGAVAGHDPSAPTAVLTGSSVSSLVVAAAAAAVAHYFGELPPADVMDLVYRAGDDLQPALPEFCLGSDAATPCPSSAYGALRPSRRRASVCAAVREACRIDPGRCPMPPPDCAPWPAPAPLAVSFGPFDAAAPREPVVALAHPTVPACAPLTLFDASGTGAPLLNPCPQLQYHGLSATPWTGPQPGMVPCPNCPMSQRTSGFYRLRIEIADDFAGILHDPALVFDGKSYSLPGVAPLAAGDRLVIDDIPYSGTGPITLVFTVELGGLVSSATSPILVVD